LLTFFWHTENKMLVNFVLVQKWRLRCGWRDAKFLEEVLMHQAGTGFWSSAGSIFVSRFCQQISLVSRFCQQIFLVSRFTFCQQILSAYFYSQQL
jgi:hypothetical protein